MLLELTRIRRALQDRYQVEHKLGEGGMARVYLAHDIRHNRPVAVKVFKEGIELDPERFRREIEVTAQLTHPNIVPVFDSGTTDDLLYYVMPFLTGRSLRDLLRAGSSMPVSEALRIACEVAEALGVAHEKGIVHRDIKPENILLVAGHAIVSDFGIAHVVQAFHRTPLTATGGLMGTFGYMSPEQSVGLPVDARTDVYALGCVLWEMLYGEPFVDVMASVSADSPIPSLRERRPDIPERADQAIQRALELQPADRFADGAEFREALSGEYHSTELVQDDSGAQVVQPRVSTMSHIIRDNPLLTGFAAFTAVAVIIGFFWWGSARPSGSDPEFDLSRAAVLQFVTHSPSSPGLGRRLSNAFVDRLQTAITIARPSDDAENLSIARETNSAYVVRTNFDADRGATTLAVSIFNAFDGTTEDLRVTANHLDSLARLAADSVTSIILSQSRALRGQVGCSDVAESEMQAARTARADGQAQARAEEGAFSLASFRRAEAAYGRAIQAGCRAGYLGRGWVRLEKGRLVGALVSGFPEATHDSMGVWLELAIEDADAAVAPDSSMPALELLGSAMYEQFSLGLVDELDVVRRAETLLTRVIEESSSVSSYLTLTRLYYDLDDVGAAGHLANAAENRRSVFAQAPEDVLLRVFWTAFDLRDAETALDACRSHPADIPSFALCRLWLMAEGVLSPDLDSVAGYLERIRSVGSHHRAEADLVGAAIYADEGFLERARRLIEEAEAIRLSSPVMTAYSWPLAAKEAWARAKVGQVDEPMQLLLAYLDANPTHRFCPNDTRWVTLREHRQFADITTSNDDPLCREMETEDSHAPP